MSSDPVIDSLSEHRELLQALEETEYAPPTHEAMSKHLAQAKAELRNEELRLQKLVESTRKEFKDWEDIKNRTHKRLAVKIKSMSSAKDKLDAMEEKEEREYVEAFGREQDSRAKISELKSQITDLEQQIKQLSGYVNRNKHLQAQLAHLYRRVFDGPTPQYPQEDAAENAYKQAEKNHRDLLEGQANMRRANQLAQRAKLLMVSAQRSAREALSASSWDVMGGGRMADYMERSALAQAQNCIDQARMVWSGAKQIIHDLPPFPQTTMPMGNLFGDVFFDNMWSDIAFHRKIQDANARLDAGSAIIRQGADAVNARTADAERAALRSQAEINVARRKLDGIRREIFERAANPAPQYSAAPSGEQSTFAPPTGPPPATVREAAQAAQDGQGGFAAPAGPPPGSADIPSVPPPEYRP